MHALASPLRRKRQVATFTSGELGKPAHQIEAGVDELLSEALMSRVRSASALALTSDCGLISRRPWSDSARAQRGTGSSSTGFSFDMAAQPTSGNLCARLAVLMPSLIHRFCLAHTHIHSVRIEWLNLTASPRCLAGDILRKEVAESSVPRFA